VGRRNTAKYYLNPRGHPSRRRRTGAGIARRALGGGVGGRQSRFCSPLSWHLDWITKSMRTIEDLSAIFFGAGKFVYVKGSRLHVGEPFTISCHRRDRDGERLKVLQPFLHGLSRIE